LRLDAPSIGQAQGKGRDSTIEPGDFHGNGRFGAEFLRLHEGAAGERLARNTRRKSDSNDAEILSKLKRARAALDRAGGLK